MAKPKILMVASEVAPFARTGGLGDVLGALPKALARAGHEVKVFLPRYGSIDPTIRTTILNLTASIPIGNRMQTATAESCRDSRTKVEYFFVRNGEYFARQELYTDANTGRDYSDNDERFAFFSRAVLELVRQMGWKPDIIHVHDWQTALIPAYLKSVYAGDPAFDGVKTMLTIHNLHYQGTFPGDQFPTLGLPKEQFYAMTGQLEYYGKVNFLKGGILFADKITTVSPRYAIEIQSGDEFGAGLQGVLQQRAKDVAGILNGVDYSIWSPSRDKLIPYRFTLSNLSGKRKNKIELVRESGLPLRETAPLVGIVSRLTAQKGFDLIEAAAEKLFGLNLQMVILGDGEQKYQTLLQQLEKEYPDKLKVYLRFDDALAHKIEAASDMFLMPSRWEPCGLNQLYSLKYGTVPVVREVGGLADTVINVDPHTYAGTGFVFTEYDPDAMIDAVARGVLLFPRKRIWTKIMKAGMTRDFSWDSAAGQYSHLYESLVAGSR